MALTRAERAVIERRVAGLRRQLEDLAARLDQVSDDVASGEDDGPAPPGRTV
jgi:hypothetical protein